MKVIAEIKALNCKLDVDPKELEQQHLALCIAAPPETDPATIPMGARLALARCKKDQADAKAAGGAANAGAPAQEPAPEQCAVVNIEDVKPPGQVVEPPDPAPEQPKTLALAHNPAVAQCSDTGGGCAFTTSVSNPADAPEFNGPISFVVHLSQPDGSVFPNITMERVIQETRAPGVTAKLVCKKDGNDVTCTSQAMTKIPPGKTVPVQLTFKPGSGTNATAIKSCASFAGGEPTCASIPLIKGPLLRAEKQTVAESCVPSCFFNIFLTNVGNAGRPWALRPQGRFHAHQRRYHD
jgi:hypothetical protein